MEDLRVEADEVEDVVASLLAGSSTFFLSTAGEDGPWGAGTFFAEHGMFELSLIVERHGRTLRNLRQDPRVAMVVSTGDPFAPFLQGSADVEILEDDAQIQATGEFIQAKDPQIAPLLGAPVVALRLHVNLWKVTDVTKGWLPARELRAPQLV